MLTVEISQLYALSPPPSPPPADKKPPQPAAGLPSSHAASAPPSNETSRRFRYTPRETTDSLLVPQGECPSSRATKNEAQQNSRFARRNEEISRLFPVDEKQSPPPVKKQPSTAGAKTPPSEEKQASTDLRKPSETRAAAMPAGVKSATPTPFDPLTSHREANALTMATPEQRRFHQSLRPSSPRIGAHPSTQPRRPVLQKRAHEHDIKCKDKPATSTKTHVGVTASTSRKDFYTEKDVQRDLKTLSDTHKLLVPAIELNAARLPMEQLEHMVEIALKIQSFMKKIEQANPASRQEAAKLRRHANELSSQAKSHLIYIRNHYVRETPPRPDVRKPPSVKTAVMIEKETEHAAWRQQFSAYRKQQRDMLELKKTIGHCFIEYPAMQYRTKKSKENIVDFTFASTKVLLGFGANAESCEVQWAQEQSEPDAGYCSQASNETSPVASPVHAAPPGPPKWEQAAAARYEQSNGPVFIAGNLRKTAFMPEPKPPLWRRLLKRIGAVLVPPTKGRSLLPIPESQNVSLLSYTRKP